MSRGSIGGVTVGSAWVRNNPELVYPEGHEDMTDEQLELALRVDPIEKDVDIFLENMSSESAADHKKMES